MNATTVTAIALAAAVVGNWAHNKPSITVKGSVGAAFILIVIAAADNGKTAPIAQGMAWLILAAVLLSKNSPIAGISKTINAYNPPKPSTKKK